MEPALKHYLRLKRVAMHQMLAGDVARYMSTWRRDASGAWRIVFDNGVDTCDCRKP